MKNLLFIGLAFSSTYLSAATVLMNQDPDMKFVIDKEAQEILLVQGNTVHEKTKFVDRDRFIKAKFHVQNANSDIDFAKMTDKKININTSLLDSKEIDFSYGIDLSQSQLEAYEILSGQSAREINPYYKYELLLLAITEERFQISINHNFMEISEIKNNLLKSMCKMSKEDKKNCLDDIKHKYEKSQQQSIDKITQSGEAEDELQIELERPLALIENRRALIEQYGVEKLAEKVMNLANKLYLEKHDKQESDQIVSFVKSENEQEKAIVITDREEIPEILKAEFKQVIEFTGNNQGAIGW